MALQANRPLPDSYRLGELTIEKVLSSGGFSIVYLARDDRWGPFVIKEFLPTGIAERHIGDQVVIIEGKQGLFNRGLRSFMDEAAALARVDHPNIVRVKDFFRGNGTAYMVMQHMRGRTLQFHIHAQRSRLDERFLRTFFLRLLNGLREVHLRRLLHLDIKPANILLGVDGQPLLLDFGAVRNALDEAEPQVKSVLTEGFAAPEQHAGDAGLGPWTDIYAVGATLYSCLAGHPPPSARVRLREDRLVPASVKFYGRCSSELLATIDWCLELEALKRPQSVYALQRALQDGTGVPRSPLQQLRRRRWSLRMIMGRMRGLVSSGLHGVSALVSRQAPQPGAAPSKPPESPNDAIKSTRRQ
ncbi:MAG: serine/threonine protein kinase [Pseudomonadota bacterium]|nr:serine/threonine protein kinase [Pseudomonadota bacterium]